MLPALLQFISAIKELYDPFSTGTSTEPWTTIESNLQDLSHE